MPRWVVSWKISETVYPVYHLPCLTILSVKKYFLMAILNFPWCILRLSFWPVAGCLGEDADSHLATASFQVVVESSQFSAGHSSIPKLTNIINRVLILNNYKNYMTELTIFFKQFLFCAPYSLLNLNFNDLQCSKKLLGLSWSFLILSTGPKLFAHRKKQS